MFVVELAFTGHPSRLELRPRHRELLTELHAAGELLDAGPLEDGTGSLCFFTATRDRVDAAVAADPYFSCDGVSIVGIREVTTLFGT